MSKILLTGGAGFIGERLASALLAEGHEVHIVDNLARGRRDAALEALLSDHRAHFAELDLLQRDAVERYAIDFDIIVHLAAIVGVQNVIDHPYRTLRDNVLMQEALIDLARRQKKLKRFLFASTSEVYAGSLPYLDVPFPTPEETPLVLPPLTEPRSTYSLSKICGEALLVHAGLPFTIVRPHNIYGPRMGMAHVIPQLLEKAHHAKSSGTIEVFSVDHRRTFCFIDDAVAMLARAIFAPATENKVVNLGAERPEVTIGHVAQIVIDTVGKPLRIAPAPATQGSPARRVPRMKQMTDMTGYVAQVPLEEGIRRTYAWYRTHIFH
jgi:UDP-glucose 4-epimerase